MENGICETGVGYKKKWLRWIGECGGVSAGEGVCV